MMMESENSRDDQNHQNSGGGGGSSNSRGKAISRPPEALINCPRCDSPNTKFCYFNNYSLTQPRHFCKTCRRYWTKGGALRNVPVGGGCRKNKKMSKSSSSRLSADSKDSSGASSNYSDLGGFKFFNGLSPAEYPLGGGLTNFSRLNTISTTPPLNNNQFFSSFGDISSASGFGMDPNSGNNLSQFMAFNNFPVSSSSSLVKHDQGDIGFNGVLLHDIGTNGNLASPIESLSSINQDLHWKLQQQRFNSILNGADVNNQQNEMISNTPNLENQNRIQKPQPILFQNLEISSKPEGSRKDSGINASNLATEWYFGNSTSWSPAVNNNSSNNGKDNSNVNGIQAWGNFDQYTALP